MPGAAPCRRQLSLAVGAQLTTGPDLGECPGLLIGQGLGYPTLVLSRRVANWGVALALTGLLSGCGGAAVMSTASPTTSESAPSPSASPTLAPGLIQAVDLTWVSAQQGWALATTPTCAGITCIAVLTTTNGGRSWATLTQLDACLNLTQCGGAADIVTNIRFATPEIGYLYGAISGNSPIMLTTDGGHDWTVEPGPYTVALDLSGGEAMRISSPHGGCPGPCDPSIDVAPLGSNLWTSVLAPTPTYNDGAELVRQGAEVYTLFPGNRQDGVVSSQHADLYISMDGGAHWRHEDDPCGYTGTTANDAQTIAAAPQGVLVVLCAPRPQGASFIIISTDEGATFGSPEPIPAGFTQLAAASSSSLVLGNAANSGGPGPIPYQLLYSGDGGQQWRTVVTLEALASPVPPSFLGFESVSDGRWIGPTGVLWTTTDSGATWTKSQF